MGSEMGRGMENNYSQEIKSSYDKVLQRALSLTRDQEKAADLAQQTITKALESQFSFRGDAQVTTWLYRILTNLFINEVRAEKRHTTNPVSDDEIIAIADKKDAEHNDLVNDIYLSDAFKKAVQALPQDQQIILQAELEGLDNEEMAARFSIGVGAAKSRLFRAKQMLKQELEKLGIEKEDIFE